MTKFNSSRWQRSRTFAQGVLNGIVGDYLHKQGNSLAIDMNFYHKGQILPLDPCSIGRYHQHCSPKLCIFVHGLTNTESIWQLPDANNRDYGDLLSQDLGYTPFYLRYNTGLAIADNGRQFSSFLDRLISNFPGQVDDITLIGFSMGGLVVRAACADQQAHSRQWQNKVKRCIYIGSPLQGAPLEKLGAMSTQIARLIPRDYMHAFADILDARSTGIKNLRHGQIEVPESLPALLEEAQHYAISGGVGDGKVAWVNALLGDGLVREPSARGQHKASTKSLAIPEAHHKAFPGLHHLALAHDLGVYQQLRQWCHDE